MKKIKKSKIYNALTSSGKLKFWRGFVIESNGEYYTQSEYWQDKGKHTLSDLTLVKGKNIGKKNATSDKEQAIFDLGSTIRKKEDEGYITKGKEYTNTRPLPMLAQSFKKRSKDIVFPCMAQYKYDGCRAPFYAGEFYSRKNKNFIPECTKHITDILKITDEIILDGELMFENKSFDDTIEAIKKYRPGVSEKLFYYVYDIIDTNLTFKERYEYIQKNIKVFESKGNIKIAETVVINDREELEVFSKKALSLGYEGIILRNTEGLYKVKHRSKDLQKYKPLLDDEFEIADAEEGKGRNKGCVIWHVKTKNDTITKCPQQGTLEKSKELYKNYKDYIGKKITVEFQDYTPDGKLRFPSAKAIRDYE